LAKLPELSADLVGLGMIWMSSKPSFDRSDLAMLSTIAGIRGKTSACAFTRPSRAAVQWLNRVDLNARARSSLSSRALVQDQGCDGLLIAAISACRFRLQIDLFATSLVLVRARIPHVLNTHIVSAKKMAKLIRPATSAFAASSPFAACDSVPNSDNVAKWSIRFLRICGWRLHDVEEVVLLLREAAHCSASSMPEEGRICFGLPILDEARR